MGIEYRISCPAERLDELKKFLERRGGRPCAEFPEQIEFRFRESRLDEMPDATAIVEAAGLYFCDHGAAREAVAVLFREIIDEVLRLSDASDSTLVTSL